LVLKESTPTKFLFFNTSTDKSKDFNFADKSKDFKLEAEKKLQKITNFLFKKPEAEEEKEADDLQRC